MQNFLSRARATSRLHIMMISAKGGVGKSTLTVNLAAALQAKGLRVGIFDGDIHGPNIPALLGIAQKRGTAQGQGEPPHPELMMPIEARLDGMDARPIKPYERYGLMLMSLGLVVGEQQAITPEASTAGKMIAVMLHRMDWSDSEGNPADVVLVDMPPGTGEPLHTFIEQGMVDGAILVATREKLAHLDNGRLLRLLKHERVPVLGVVENMTHVICPRCGELIEMYPAPAAEEAVYAGVPVLGALPFHPDFLRETRPAAPLALRTPDTGEPESPARAPLFALADAAVTAMSSLKGGAVIRRKVDECEDCP